jgi:hypothetical protein
MWSPGSAYGPPVMSGWAPGAARCRAMLRLGGDDALATTAAPAVVTAASLEMGAS